MSILLFKGRPFAHGGVQNLLADPQAFRRYLQKLIRVNEVQGLFQAHDFGRRQLQRLIRAGRTCVGQFLCLSDIDFNVLCLGALAHNHA